jgi:hypothetical protein
MAGAPCLGFRRTSRKQAPCLPRTGRPVPPRPGAALARAAGWAGPSAARGDAGSGRRPPADRSSRRAAAARHPSTLLGMALSIVEGPHLGHARTSKPKLRRIHCAHDDPPEPEDAGAGRAAAGATGSVAGRRMPGGAHGSLGAECAGPHEVPVAPSLQGAGPTAAVTPSPPLAAAITRARRRACGPKTRYYRTRLMRGRGVTAASRSSSSIGSNTRCVVPSVHRRR